MVIRWEEEDWVGGEFGWLLGGNSVGRRGMCGREIIVCQMFRRWVAGGS